jgi:SAM-dependent methyltransferase
MLPFSEACERNKAPILAVLRVCFADRAHVLEIGSGTGQHAVHFAGQLTHLNYLPDLAARVQAEGGANLRPPTVLDVRQSIWPLRSVDAVFTANTLHIMSWTSVLAMFRGIGSVLAPGGVMCIYGPFRYNADYTSESNRAFDHSLEERDPASGLRDIREVTAAAEPYGLSLRADHDLPAFNRLLILAKEPA